MTIFANFNRRMFSRKTITSFYIVFCYISVKGAEEEGFCPIDHTGMTKACSEQEPDVNQDTKFFTRYLLYDVNPPEGFNLRRDVYMRLAIFIRTLKKHGDWRLVLPPWGKIYHWQSTDVGQQELLPWREFFDIPSLQKFAPVIEMEDYMKRIPRNEEAIHEVYVLQHYKDMWEESREWKDKWDIETCHIKIPYTKVDDSYEGPFWGYNNITARKVFCASFQGHASLLKEILTQSKATSTMIDHAEVALHDFYGDATYWQARRSMRFASNLVEIAQKFRRESLNSTDEADDTLRPLDWREEYKKQNTKGGPYIAVHLRRNDFLWGRSKEVPDLEFAAQQLQEHLSAHKLDSLFVATDAPKSELTELKTLLSKFKVYSFDPTPEIKKKIKDGGKAIVDQIICSHAQYFTGTHESTFSFRIQEEREIMGFNGETTFNRLCGRKEGHSCAQPTRWKITF